MSGSPLRWPTKQVCIKCPFTQDLSSSPTGLYIYTPRISEAILFLVYSYIYIYICIYNKVSI